MSNKLHLHSMMVHSVAALSPLAAVAFILFKQQVTISSINQDTWSFLTIFSLIMMFLITFPSILSGIFERSHVYAKWHSTHKIKMGLSVLLLIVMIIELAVLSESGLQSGLFSALGILIIFGNNIISFLLCANGLKITLGRQSLEKTSYEADLFKNDPIDILVAAGELKKEEPKYLDPLKER